MAKAAVTMRRSLRNRIRFLLDRAATAQRMVIVDVGANPVIPPPYRELMQAMGCTVVGFEPQADAFTKLQAEAAENERYVNAALGAPGKGTLHIYPTDGFTSLFPLHRPSLDFLGRFQRQLREERTLEVELHAMDDLADVPQIDLLKIDVQGAEVDIYRTSAKKLAQAVAVITEVRFYQLYKDEPTLGDLDNALRAQGFVLHKFLPTKRAALPNSQNRRLAPRHMKNQLVDGDAVYIRSMEDIEAWSSDQLKHLALSAGTVFDSQDLALRCLDVLAARGDVTPDTPEKYADLLPAQYLLDKGPGDA